MLQTTDLKNRRIVFVVMDIAHLCLANTKRIAAGPCMRAGLSKDWSWLAGHSGVVRHCCLSVHKFTVNLHLSTGLYELAQCQPCVGGLACDEEGLVTPYRPCAPGYFCRSWADMTTPNLGEKACCTVFCWSGHSLDLSHFYSTCIKGRKP